MRQLFIVSALLLSAGLIQAQDQKIIDSLKSAIVKAERLPDSHSRDTSICNAYLNWGEQVYLNNPDTAMVLWKRANHIATHNLETGSPKPLKNKYLSIVGNALNNIAAIHNLKGDVAKGLDYYFRSLKIQEELGMKKEIATCLNNIGYAYNSQGNVAKGLEYYFKGFKIYEEVGDMQGAATSLNNIGYVYKCQGEIEKGLEYYRKSLKIREEIGDKNGIATSLNNIGYMYDSEGNAAKGLEYYRKSLKIYEEIGDMYGTASSLNNIGAIYQDQGETQKGLEYFLKSLKIEEEIGDKYGVVNSLNNIGTIHFNLDDISEAKKYAKRSIEVAQELGFPEGLKAPAHLLSKVYKVEGNYKEALEMYELHIQMRDSINNEETQKATIRQQTKYEFEKAQLVKEQEEEEAARVLAEETRRRNNLQYSVILLGLLVLGSLILALGKLSLPVRMAEGIIFFSFLILFEFLLVLADPYIDTWSGGAPGIKLLFNAGIAALIFPMHAFFEAKLKGRLVKQ